MDIWVNGERRAVDDHLSVLEVLQYLGVPEQVVIVERNMKIIPREQYGREPVEAGDKLELVRLMGGG